MLIRMTPEQISEYWEQLEFAIAESLPPTVGESHDKMNNILMALLESRMQAWASYSLKESSAKVSGFVITQVMDDTASKTRSLLIYCLYGYEEVDKKEWMEGLQALRKYKDSVGCRRIIAYSNIDNIISLVKRLGGNTDYTFLYFE